MTTKTQEGIGTMLELAIRSRVPLITCTTQDSVNAREIIEHLAGEDVALVTDVEVDTIVEDHDENIILMHPLGEVKGDFETLYEKLVTGDKTLILYNTEYESTLFSDCGVIPVPKDMVTAILAETLDIEDVRAYVDVLGGMTLKTIGEVVRLTATRDDDITVEGLIKTRKEIMPPTQGLSQLDTKMSFYQPDTQLLTWLDDNRKFLEGNYEARLRPRGLMFDGGAGCGKTQGAKYIANTFGLPLYLLDLPNLMTRWHGESETNLRNALQQLDEESPCVCLMDEVDKLFVADNEGTTARLLGQLLWWMQERTSNVFVVLTCNDKDKIPRELYREGRIDEVMVFNGMREASEITKFFKELLPSFDSSLKKPTAKAVKELVTALCVMPTMEEAEELGLDLELGDKLIRPVSYAKATQAMIKLIKTLN